MAKSVRDQASHSAEILVEVRPQEVSGDLGPRVALPEEFQRRAGEIADSVGEIVDQLKSRLERVLKPTHDGNWGVESVEIGFGITVQAEAGVLIARASSGATFTARVTIKRPPETP